MKQFSKAIILLSVFFIPITGCAQQQVDNDFTPRIDKPLFEKGKGPVMLVDGGHHNFHTLADKFAPFGKVAEMDGFRVQNIPGKIESAVLSNAKILVIANALHERNIDSWQLPVPSAFTPEEVKQVRDWVWNGGRLFLIADHMPFPGAVADVAQSMGFAMYNGFVLRRPKQKFDTFSLNNGMLNKNEMTTLHGSVDSVVSFTGQAFKIHDSAISVITLDSNFKILLPEVAWEFSNDTKMIPAEGLSQLAYSRYGAGKVVVAGEAAMFTAQKAGDVRIGLSSSFAPNNLQLLLNIFEWLNK